MSGNFKEDVKLDPYALDDANIIQAELYAEWGERWADAVKERDYLKEEVSVVRSSIDEQIRNKPEKFGWEGAKSPTEAFINSQIVLHPDYIDIMEKLNKAQYNVNMMVVAKEAIEHKGKSIDRELDMIRLGYKVAAKKESLSRKEHLTNRNEDAQNESLKKNRRMRKEE